MISEHERLTDERLSIYTLPTVDKGKLEELALTVFDEWKKTAPRPPNSVVILIDADHGKIAIHPGLGIDPVLTSDKVSEVSKRFFKPEWETDHHARAVVLSLVEVLRVLGSPLIASGEAVEGYEHAGFSGGWEPVVPPGRNSTGWIFAMVGLAAVGFVLARILIGEVHYTAQGWFPIPASQNLRRIFRRPKKTTLVTGGGISGDY